MVGEGMSLHIDIHKDVTEQVEDEKKSGTNMS